MLKKINKVVLLLTASDTFTWGPYLIISGLTGIYLADKLGENAVSLIGLGTGIYFLTRAAFQIPIGLITDKIDNDKDEILLLILGTLLMGLPFLFYPLITEAYQYYILQFVFGFGVSLNLPNWRKLFAINMKDGEEGLSYGFYETVLSIITALFSALAGYIASQGDIQFDIVMISSGVLMMSASLWIIFINKVKNRKSNHQKKIAVEKVIK